MPCSPGSALGHAGAGRVAFRHALRKTVCPGVADDDGFSAAMEALSSASARGSGGVLRTFSGASASRLSGISRMSGSALGAMKFMRISLEGCEHAARGDPLRPPRALPNGGPAPAPGGATRRSPAPEAGGRCGTAVSGTVEEGVGSELWRSVALRAGSGGAMPSVVARDTSEWGADRRPATTMTFVGGQ